MSRFADPILRGNFRGSFRGVGRASIVRSAFPTIRRTLCRGNRKLELTSSFSKRWPLLMALMRALRIARQIQLVEKFNSSNWLHDLPQLVSRRAGTRESKRPETTLRRPGGYNERFYGPASSRVIVGTPRGTLASWGFRLFWPEGAKRRLYRKFI